MPTLKDTAICIRHWDWSETSQTVSLFTAEHGVIRGLAKGSRRERSSFSGGIELLTRGEVVFLARPTASTTTLSQLTAWDLQEPYAAIRRSLAALHSAMFLADLVHHAVENNDPHPALFASLDRSVGALAEGSAPGRVVLFFLWKVLSETGYRPDVWCDPRTGAAIQPTRVYEFSPKFGGLLGPAGPDQIADHVRESTSSAGLARPGSARPGAGQMDRESWKVRPDTVQVLRRVGSAEESLDPSGIVADTSIPEEAVVRASALLASYFRFIHRAWPPSIRWVLPELVRT